MVAGSVEPVGPARILPYMVQALLYATIVRETNVYARQVLGDGASEKWTNVDADDISAFWGFALLMGINRLPVTSVLEHQPAVPLSPHRRANNQGSLSGHLEVPPLHHKPIPITLINGRVIICRRVIFFFIRYHTYPGQIVEGPAHNISSCGTNYRPHREQAIDEAMVAFKGRSSMKHTS